MHALAVAGTAEAPAVSRHRATSPVYERVLPALSTNVTQIRCELDDVLESLHVDAARRADIALVVGEAAANVVIHAYADMPPGPLVVHAVALGPSLEISISDSGRGMLPRSDSPGLGFGLSLMSQLSDVLEVCSCDDECGLQVVAVFENAIPATQPPAAVSHDASAKRPRA